MIEISDAIKEGAHAYLARQFLVASLFAVGITALLGFVLGIQVAVSFALGAILSGVSAYVGMRVSIYTNSRAAHAACKSAPESHSMTLAK